MKRILAVIPMIFAISFIAFALINLIPSDPAEVALRVNDIIPTQEAIESMRIQLGLNDPFFVRYFKWLWQCMHLDFGVSYVNNNRAVIDEIMRSLPPTLILALFSIIFIEKCNYRGFTITSGVDFRCQLPTNEFVGLS